MKRVNKTENNRILPELNSPAWTGVEGGVLVKLSLRTSFPSAVNADHAHVENWSFLFYASYWTVSKSWSGGGWELCEELTLTLGAWSYAKSPYWQWEHGVMWGAHTHSGSMELCEEPTLTVGAWSYVRSPHSQWKHGVMWGAHTHSGSMELCEEPTLTVEAWSYVRSSHSQWEHRAMRRAHTDSGSSELCEEPILTAGLAITGNRTQGLTVVRPLPLSYPAS